MRPDPLLVSDLANGLCLKGKDIESGIKNKVDPPAESQGSEETPLLFKLSQSLGAAGSVPSLRLG